MKKRKVTVLAVILLVITVVGIIVYDYTFNTKHRDIASEEAAIALSANELFSHFQKDESLATTKYLDKVIEISGKLSSIEQTEVVLNKLIQVRFSSKLKLKAAKGTTLTIKGRCVGYDELLEMVKIDQATIINKEY